MNITLLFRTIYLSITLTLFLTSPIYAELPSNAKAETSKKVTSEEQKIKYLIKQVNDSGVIFIRNGDEHTAKEASEHLAFKYKKATNMFWFFGPKTKVTAKEFINKIASQSSTTGKPYLIRLKDGKTVTTKEWLDNKLSQINDQ
tara:strand:- start:115919 stop:116350 length:432 start_codon:yes stop_codon:yes gene_type:complete